MTDNEQFSTFFDGCVSRHRLTIVDVTVFVYGFEFWIKRETPCAVFDDVSVVVAVFYHAQHEAMVNPKDFGDRVVLERNDHHVLGSDITMDVRLVKCGDLSWEEGVR